MAIICLDSQVIIWGVKGEANESQQGMIPFTSRYIAYLTNQKAEIIVPSIVLAELMMGSSSSIQDKLQESFGRHLRIVPFDPVAAVHFSKVWRARNDDGTIARLKVDHSARRNELKADAMIVATALAVGADTIVSNDGGLRGMAQGFIEAIDIPDIGSQPNLL